MKKTLEQINATMKELAEYTEMADELKLQIDALKDEIKEYMKDNDVTEIVGDNGEKATWRDVISNRFDSTAFKKDFSDIYREYTRKTTYKRFTFNK